MTAEATNSPESEYQTHLRLLDGYSALCVQATLNGDHEGAWRYAKAWAREDIKLGRLAEQLHR